MQRKIRLASLCLALAAPVTVTAAWATEDEDVVIPLRGNLPIAEEIPDAPQLKDAVPDAEGIHRAVVMQGLDKITGRTSEFLAPVGVPVPFFRLSITAHDCNQRPPEEPPETTAYLDILENTLDGRLVKLFSGWMFASSPAMNALEHPVYDVWVVSCKTDAPETVATPTTPLIGGTAAAPPPPEEPERDWEASADPAEPPAAPAEEPATPPATPTPAPKPVSNE